MAPRDVPSAVGRTRAMPLDRRQEDRDFGALTASVESLVGGVNEVANWIRKHDDRANEDRAQLEATPAGQRVLRELDRHEHRLTELDDDINGDDGLKAWRNEIRTTVRTLTVLAAVPSLVTTLWVAYQLLVGLHILAPA